MRSSAMRAQRHHLRRATAVNPFYMCPMGLRIRELRDAKGWTQQHLASLAGISRSQLAMIETGTRPANTLRLRAIAKALGVSEPDLFPRNSPEATIFACMPDLSDQDQAMLASMAEALAAKNRATKG